MVNYTKLYISLHHLIAEHENDVETSLNIANDI